MYMYTICTVSIYITRNIKCTLPTYYTCTYLLWLCTQAVLQAAEQQKMDMDGKEALLTAMMERGFAVTAEVRGHCRQLVMIRAGGGG